MWCVGVRVEVGDEVQHPCMDKPKEGALPCPNDLCIDHDPLQPASRVLPFPSNSPRSDRHPSSRSPLLSPFIPIVTGRLWVKRQTNIIMHKTPDLFLFHFTGGDIEV